MRCRSCGVPLAEDQRYCLNCGERQGEPRIDFGQYEVPASQPQEAAPPPPTEEKPSRDYTPLAAVGGIAVLGVMLLIGVLIGKGDSGAPAPAPAPVVVQGGEANTGETAAGEGGAGAVNGGGKQVKAKGDGGKDSGAVKGGSTNTGNAPVASDDALQQLQEGSPEEKAENSANLPDEVATPGAPPPEDSKAPGGGSKGTAIE
ncbi:MAG: hypothetical protein ABW196_11500 [Solirubrobacterales bacterium]